MEINELVYQAHLNAVLHGFHDIPREFGTLIALIHSELSEALEADRHNKRADLTAFQKGIPYDISFETYMKDTIEDELADAVIRIADLCGLYGIDLDAHIQAKMFYNKSRESLHGKQY